jgi:nodulation protein A
VAPVWSFFAEADMTPALEAEIRAMLIAAFPQFADFFATVSFRGSVPEHRLVGRGSDGELVAHLEGGPREVLADGQPVRILGIGAVAVNPKVQGVGLGKEMFKVLRQHAIDNRLADFGFLQCHEAVADFYQSAGFCRVKQPCVSMHHETREWETHRGPVMVMPLTKPIGAWPSGGEVHLQGFSW